MNRMIFVPVSRAEAVALRDAAWTDVDAFAATADLVAAVDDPTADAEELDFVATTQAAVAALTRQSDPLRLVLAAEVTAVQEVDDASNGASLGAVRVATLSWSSVTALFADEPAAAGAVAAARAAIADRPDVEVGELAAVRALLDGHDLLWFAPEELDQLS